jgi:hypothetical protein
MTSAVLLLCACLLVPACGDDAAVRPADAGRDLNLDARDGPAVEAGRDLDLDGRDGPAVEAWRDLDVDGSNDGQASLDSDGTEAAICGANQVLPVGSCASLCPGPCRCMQLVWDPVPSPGFPALCGVPCANAWDCQGNQRCGYGVPEQDAGGPVCLPQSAIMPLQGDAGPGFVDCFGQLGGLRCEGGHLVQKQSMGLAGEYQGCIAIKVRVEDCASGCEATDAGVRCKGPWPDAGPTDGGFSCCPGQAKPQPLGCFGLGGQKAAPYGCRIECCERYADAGCPPYVQVTTPAGCKQLLAQPRDAGMPP